MLMLLIYVIVAAYLISKIERKGLASFYAVLAFASGYVLFALIGYFLMHIGVIRPVPWYEDTAANNQYQAVRLVLGVLQTAFSLYLLSVVLPKGNVKMSAVEKSKAIFSRIKQVFHDESTWRLFLVLQLIGIVAIIYVDISNRDGWNFLPELFNHRNQFAPSWDFLESYFWTRKSENWVTLLGLLGPVITAKSVSWIQTADKRDS